MRRSLSSALLMGLLLGSSVLGAAADGPLKSDVQRALDLLNAPSLAERTRAEQRLIELGPNVLPLLPPPDLVTAVSAKQAIKRVRVQLEQTAAKDSIAPSKLTLNGSYSVAELATQIEQQTRNRILMSESVSAINDRKLSVNWSSRTFWDAMTELEQQGLSIEFAASRSAYVWTKQSPERRVVASNLGGFRVSASPLEVRRSATNAGRLLHAGVTISAEPRLRPLLLRYSAADFALGSDRAIAPFDPEAKIEVPLGDGGRISQFSLTFADSKTDAKKSETQEVFDLAGKVRLVVAAGEVPIEFKEFGRSQGVARRYGGVSVTLSNVRLKRSANGKLAASLRLQVAYDSPQHAFESHQLWVFHNQVFLKSPTGQQVSHTGGAETLFHDEGVVAVEYRFEDLPDEARLWSCNYVAPTLLIEVPLEFRLRSVPVKAAD